MPSLAQRLRNIDIQIGQRLKELRIRRNISQTKLGDMLGLTFQQIQKYEKGMNRIAGSTLWDLSQRLDVPITWFFEGIEQKCPSKDLPKLRQSDSVFYDELSKLPDEIRTALRLLVQKLSKNR